MDRIQILEKLLNRVENAKTGHFKFGYTYSLPVEEVIEQVGDFVELFFLQNVILEWIMTTRKAISFRGSLIFIDGDDVLFNPTVIRECLDELS